MGTSMVRERNETMRKNMIANAKYIVSVVSDKATHDIKIKSVFDKKADRYLSHDEVVECGLRDYTYSDSHYKDSQIVYRTALDYLKEDLNWMLNGNSDKYQFSWGQSGTTTSEGTAYVFD